MKRLLPLAAAAVLAGCVNYHIVEGDGLPRARIGQAVKIGSFDLTPLEVIEDSRCATGVQCVWAGRLRLRARIDFNDSIDSRELTLGEAQALGGGMLKLVEATPYPREGTTIYPEDYGFAFAYTPGVAN